MVEEAQPYVTFQHISVGINETADDYDVNTESNTIAGVVTVTVGVTVPVVIILIVMATIMAVLVFFKFRKLKPPIPPHRPRNVSPDYVNVDREAMENLPSPISTTPKSPPPYENIAFTFSENLNTDDSPANHMPTLRSVASYTCIYVVPGCDNAPNSPQENSTQGSTNSSLAFSDLGSHSANCTTKMSAPKQNASHSSQSPGIPGCDAGMHTPLVTPYATSTGVYNTPPPNTTSRRAHTPLTPYSTTRVHPLLVRPYTTSTTVHTPLTPYATTFLAQMNRVLSENNDFYEVVSEVRSEPCETFRIASTSCFQVQNSTSSDNIGSYESIPDSAVWTPTCAPFHINASFGDYEILSSQKENVTDISEQKTSKGSTGDYENLEEDCEETDSTQKQDYQLLQATELF